MRSSQSIPIVIVWCCCCLFIFDFVESLTVGQEDDVVDHHHHRVRRIAGGYQLGISDYPYQVSVSFGKNGDYRCGGSIIGKKWILTAAHCFKLPYRTLDQYWKNLHQFISTTAVRVGSSRHNFGGKIIYLKNIIVHKKYNSKSRADYDFALLELKKDIKYGKTRQPIALPYLDSWYNVWTKKDGVRCVVSGYGETLDHEDKNSYLRATILPSYDYQRCRENYYAWNVTNSMMCAGYDEYKVGICEGDSGGPLNCDGFLMGVASWAIGCNYKEKGPVVFAFVPAVRKWIFELTGI